jgi:hypothetical protein
MSMNRLAGFLAALSGAAIVSGVLITSAMASNVVIPNGAEKVEAVEGRVYRGMLDGRQVKFIQRSGEAIMDGDISLGKASDVLARMAAQTPDSMSLLGQAQEAMVRLRSKGNVYGRNDRLWAKNPEGIVEVPYTIDTDPDKKAPDAVNAANAQTQGFLKWIPRTSQADYVAFDLTEDADFGSCASQVGRVGGRQRISGSRACGTGTLVHEMGHAVGLWHEQQRGERDKWLISDLDNVEPQYRYNYEPPSSQRDVGGHDYGSIMHYSGYGFVKKWSPAIESIPRGVPIGGREQYSEADLEAIKRLYGVVDTVVTVDSYPKGQKVTVDGVEVTAPAKFNWAIGSTHTISVPQGVTDISNTSYTFARWSSDTEGTLSRTQTIIVTPGDGRLDRPSNRPSVSVYTAYFSAIVEVQTSSNVSGGATSLSPEPETIPGATGRYWRANTLIRNVATAPTGFQFVRWGPATGLYHYPNASNRNTNPHIAPVSVGPDIKIANWIANFSNEAQAFIRAEDGNGVAGGTSFIERTDQATASAVNTPEVSWTWTTGETRKFKAKADVQGATDVTRRIFQGWFRQVGNGPLEPLTTDQEISIPKPTGGLANNVTYVARYLRRYKAYLDVDNSTSASCGSVSVDKAPGTNGYYDHGTELVATYVPPAGMQIIKWNGNFVPVGGPSGTTARFTVNEIPEARPEINTVNEPLRIGAISPNAIDFGAAATFDITGSGFTASSQVFVNNLRRSATLVAPNRLRVTIAAADIPPLGKSTVAVANGAGACLPADFSNIDVKLAAAATTTPKTGWWWNDKESGRGFFIERQGNNLFIAGYYYEADGRASWFTSAGLMNADGVSYSGAANLLRNGQTLEGAYKSPTSAGSLGNVTLNFASPTTATIVWPGGNTPITSLTFGGAGGINAENGWWWNAAESGRGYSIEVQGNSLFMVGFMYDDSGNPTWYLTAGTMQSPTRYSGTLQSISGGQALNGPYKAPTAASVGSFAVDFTGTNDATLTLPSGKKVGITRLRF